VFEVYSKDNNKKAKIMTKEQEYLKSQLDWYNNFEKNFREHCREYLTKKLNDSNNLIEFKVEKPIINDNIDLSVDKKVVSIRYSKHTKAICLDTYLIDEPSIKSLIKIDWLSIENLAFIVSFVSDIFDEKIKKN
jgi:hypothetical protein